MQQVDRQLLQVVVDRYRIGEVRGEREPRGSLAPGEDHEGLAENGQVGAVAEDGGFVHLDDGRPGLGQFGDLLGQDRGVGEREGVDRAVAALENAPARHRVRPRQDGLQRAPGRPGGLTVVAAEERPAPREPTGDHWLAKVGVRVEEAQEAVDRDAVQVRRQIGEAVRPADLAVGGQLHAGRELLAHDLAGDLVLEPRERLGAELALLALVVGAAQALLLGGVPDTRVASSVGQDQLHCPSRRNGLRRA